MSDERYLYKIQIEIKRILIRVPCVLYFYSTGVSCIGNSFIIIEYNT